MCTVLALIWGIDALQSPARPGSASNRRVFVGSAPSQSTLVQVLSSYGSILDVSRHDTAKTPFAFVTFEEADSAEAALQCPTLDVRRAFEQQQTRAKSNTRKEKSKHKQLQILQLESTNIVCQVSLSHADRLQSLFLEAQKESSLLFQGQIETDTPSVKLLCWKCDNPIAFWQWIQNLRFECLGLNKVYVVDQLLEEERLSEALLEKCPGGSTVRCHSFPSNLFRTIADTLEKHKINLNPKNHTHDLFVVNVFSEKGFKPMFLVGSTESSLISQSAASESILKTSSTYVCRAQGKLNEAFERYPFELPKKVSVALDCGAAPGGWSQFLVEKFPWARVLSIDPGELSPKVRDAVKHYRMTVEEALPRIKSEEPTIDLWVSDMCLHSMESQVDWLLDAKNMGVLQSPTFFVLTLKCNIGYSASAFDRQVSLQLDRVRSMTRDVFSVHLLSNRSGERTVMGYLI